MEVQVRQDQNLYKLEYRAEFDLHPQPHSRYLIDSNRPHLLFACFTSLLDRYIIMYPLIPLLSLLPATYGAAVRIQDLPHLLPLMIPTTHILSRQRVDQALPREELRPIG